MMVKGALPEVFDSGEGLSGGGDVHAEECFMGQSLPVALGHAQAGHLVSRVKLLLLQILIHGRRLRRGDKVGGFKKTRPSKPLGKQSLTLATPNTDTWPQTEKREEGRLED